LLSPLSNLVYAITNFEIGAMIGGKVKKDNFFLPFPKIHLKSPIPYRIINTRRSMKGILVNIYGDFELFTDLS